MISDMPPPNLFQALTTQDGQAHAGLAGDSGGRRYP
jgi:hypothetical protein